MRIAVLTLLFLLAACRQEPEREPTAQAKSGTPAAAAVIAVMAGPGRDRLCTRTPGPGEGEQRQVAGLVTYAENGDANCLVRGSVAASIRGNEIIPNGDERCRITLVEEGADRVRIEDNGQCAYYCGPGATFAGKTFSRMDTPQAVTDIAGDPLC